MFVCVCNVQATLAEFVGKKCYVLCFRYENFSVVATSLGLRNQLFRFTLQFNLIVHVRNAYFSICCNLVVVLE